MGVTRLLASGLTRAAKFAAVAALGWLVVGVGVWSRYDARGEWYASYGNSRPILIAVGISALACLLDAGAALDPELEPVRVELRDALDASSSAGVER